MTGMAEMLRDKARMATRFYGKWDVGMATAAHTPKGRGYQRSLIYFHHEVNHWTSNFWDPTGDTNYFPTCAKIRPEYRPVDMWYSNASYEGPFPGPQRGQENSTAYNGRWPVNVSLCDLDMNTSCPPYPGWPGALTAGCTYEDDLFKGQLLSDLAEYDPAGQGDSGLFVFWAPHVVHSPLQVPPSFLAQFDHVVDWRRRRYLAMVGWLDHAVGEVLDAFAAKGMQDELLVVFSADNGGAVYDSGAGGASNFPLKVSQHQSTRSPLLCAFFPSCTHP
jgi:arylsulfatase B